MTFRQSQQLYYEYER